MNINQKMGFMEGYSCRGKLEKCGIDWGRLWESVPFKQSAWDTLFNHYIPTPSTSAFDPNSQEFADFKKNRNIKAEGPVGLDMFNIPKWLASPSKAGESTSPSSSAAAGGSAGQNVFKSPGRLMGTGDFGFKKNPRMSSDFKPSEDVRKKMFNVTNLTGTGLR